MRAEEAAAGKAKRNRGGRHPHPGVAAYPHLAERLGLVREPRPEGDGKQGDKAAEGQAEKAEAAQAEETPKVYPPPPPLNILEGLAASGLRALRYAQEVRGWKMDAGESEMGLFDASEQLV